MIADTVTTLLFCVTFAMSMIFGILSLDFKMPEWAFLSMVGWFCFGELILVLAVDVFYGFSLLFFAVGVIFGLEGFRFLFGQMEMKKEDREEEDEWEMLTD